MKSKTLPPWVINLFFMIGLVSAFLFRLLIFFNYYYTSWSRGVWYCGVMGYLFFFGFRYYISHKRRQSIIQNNLTEKVAASNIEADDKDEIIYLFQSLLRSKEMFNYIFIFSVSLLAIVADIFLTLLR
ncbi:MAG: hypothetical protein KKD44_20135 [Proteobacteria bacterium]|nr:hypothetical protein [Pseudomonadota bacterium]